MHTERQRIRRSFCFAFFLFVSGIATADATYVFFRAESQLVSEPEPLASTLRNWGSDFGRGERQWAVSHFELGARYRGIELSVQQRVLADIRLNADAAEFYSRVAQQEALQPGTTVPVHVYANGFSAQGLRVGYRYQRASWLVAAGVTFLQTDHLMAGELHGQFEADDVDVFSLTAEVDYLYYRDPIFKRSKLRQFQGTGSSINLLARWQPVKEWSIEVQAEDLFTRLKWQDIPFTIAEANTNNKSYDEEGYAIFNPTYSGRQGYRETFGQDIDPRYRARVTYSAGLWSAHLHAQHQFDYSLAGVGAGRQLTDRRRLKVLFWPQTESLELELEQGRWRMGVATDHLLSPQVKALSVNLFYGY